MAQPDEIVVEFFGMPRRRAGRAELSVAVGTVRAVLIAVQLECPGLSDLLQPTGRLAPHYLLSLDGQRFLADPDEVLPPGARLLLLSADAGG